MSTNHTANYNLCQWEATDQVQRTDFNQDNAKIDAALSDKLGKIEVIQTVDAVSNTNLMAIDLTDFDWSAWSILLFQASLSGDSYENTVKMGFNGVSGASLLASLTKRGNMLAILFPGRDPNRQVCAVGFPGGEFGFSTSPVSQLEQFSVSIWPSYFKAGDQLVLFGIR